MTLAIFDLDNTLLGGDSDYSWGLFLADQGKVDKETYSQTNAKFYQQYQQGKLDIYEYSRFSLRPLKDNPFSELLRLRSVFLQTIIEPIVLQKAIDLVEEHRSQNHTLLIITATNRFVVEPIALRYGIPYLLATDPEVKNGQFTGEISGVPCYQEGKVTRLEMWLNDQQETLEDSWFYSDSHNDIPLLTAVSHPVAVDADTELQSYADEKNWKSISLR